MNLQLFGLQMFPQEWRPFFYVLVRLLIQWQLQLTAFLLALAQIPFIINFFYSIFWGKKCEDNPWHATTLEWATPTPPPHGNFLKAPEVYRGPYEYSVPGQKHDFWPQNMKENN